MDWLRKRYAELFSEYEPRRSIAQFDLLVVLGYGVRQHRSAAFFTLASDSAAAFGTRVRRDDLVRPRVATMLGLTLEDFDARAAVHLQRRGIRGRQHDLPGDGGERTRERLSPVRDQSIDMRTPERRRSRNCHCVTHRGPPLAPS
jgi:hypothetical protein